VSAEILIPFSLDPLSGKVSQTTDPDVQQMQHVSSLVSTQPGERVMHPDYGIPLASYVFSQGAVFIADQMATDVTRQMSQWEPGIQVNNVIPVPNEDFGWARVDVDFDSTPETTGVIQTSVINVGGTVT
jgi:phage baseplate assembly protein W